MTTFASNTSVTPERSRAEIERLLMKFGVNEFHTFTKPNEGGVGFVMHKMQIAITIPLPSRQDKEYTKTRTGKDRSESEAYRQWEQACRSRWRSLCLLIKAKLVGIEEGATTFEVEFLPYMLTPSGQTIGQRFAPMIEQARKNGTGQLMLEAERG